MDFPLFTRIVCIKVIYSSSFYDFSKRSNDFAYFVEHPVYSTLKMFLSLLLLFFIFWFSTVHSNDSVKVIYFWNFRCSAKGSVLDSSFKMYAVLILFFLNFVLQVFTQRERVKVTFLKFQVLREWTNVIASFPQHFAYSSFKMFSVLILGFSFWFVMTYPKSMCKSNLFFVILGAPGMKKRYCFLCGAPCIWKFQNE